MNKISKLILVLLIISFKIQNLMAQEEKGFSGDFRIVGASGYDITATMEVVSAPFEGLTDPKPLYVDPVNRVGQIQNGCYWRFYETQAGSPLKTNIAYLSRTFNANGNIFDLGHCSGIEFPDVQEAWGFAKYKITVYVAQTGEKYQLYLNSLDSKYGMIYTGGYGADLTIKYDISLLQNKRLVFYKTRYGVTTQIDVIETTDVLPDGQPSKEFKLWEVVGGYNSPLETNFSVRSTPFPINPRLIELQHIRVLELGTKVVFDNVYNYTGESDRYGYNTIDSANYYMYYTNPPIPSGTNLIGKTFVTPAYYYYDEIEENLVFGFRLNVKSGNEITLKNDKRLWISGFIQGNYYYGDTISFSSGSVLNTESYAQLNACRGGIIIDSCATLNLAPNSFSHIYFKSELSFLGTSNVISNSSHVEIDDNARLKIGDNSVVTFDGAGTYLKLNPNAIVQLGENAKIEFRNGAYLVADGSNISSVNSSTPGKGLYFENSGAQTSINGVSFNNLTNSIYINNTSSTYANSFKSITNNVFSFSGNEIPCYAIETKNAYNITISGNQINLQPNKGIGMLIRYSLISQEEARSTPSYAVNIQNNQIYNGVISAAFTGMASSYAGINFMYNTCSGSVSNSSLFMRQTCGNFKNNNISSGAGMSLDLNQSTPNIYSNYLTSSLFNLHNFASYPNFAPTLDNTSNGGWIWIGGRNTINSTGNGNINYDEGNVLLDWGQNCFTKNYSYHHLFGRINEPSLSYLVRNNDFNGSNEPDSYLFDISSGLEVVPYFVGSNFACSNTSDGGSIWLINDLGNGVYDTLYKTSNNSGYQPPQDEVLYSTAIQKMELGEYFDAISYFKSLITGFPASTNTEACLYSLYKCYQSLDTSSNQGIRGYSLYRP